MKAALLECSTDNPVCVVTSSQGQDAHATCKLQGLASLGDAPQGSGGLGQGFRGGHNNVWGGLLD